MPKSPFAIPNAITDSGKGQQWLLKPLDGRLLAEMISEVTGTQLNSMSP